MVYRYLDYQGIAAFYGIHNPIKVSTGILGQCVEFIRRWYIINHNLTFPNIKSARDFKHVSYMTHISSGLKIKIDDIPFDDFSKLKVGDIIVFKSINSYKPFGHLAVVTLIQKPNLVYLSEQNWPWTYRHCSRRLTKMDLVDIETIRRPILKYYKCKSLEKKNKL